MAPVDYVEFYMHMLLGAVALVTVLVVAMVFLGGASSTKFPGKDAICIRSRSISGRSMSSKTHTFGCIFQNYPK